MTNYKIHASGDHQAKMTLALDLFLKKRIENDGSGFPIYIGYAEPGVFVSESKWAIKKLTYSGGVVTQEDWASGENTFDKEWDERASYSYS